MKLLRSQPNDIQYAKEYAQFLSNCKGDVMLGAMAELVIGRYDGDASYQRVIEHLKRVEQKHRDDFVFDFFDQKGRKIDVKSVMRSNVIKEQANLIEEIPYDDVIYPLVWPLDEIFTEFMFVGFKHGSEIKRYPRIRLGNKLKHRVPWQNLDATILW
jgi:hypothetical protein